MICQAEDVNANNIIQLKTSLQNSEIIKWRLGETGTSGMFTKNGFMQREWVQGMQEGSQERGDLFSGGRRKNMAVALNTRALGFTQMVALVTIKAKSRGVTMEMAIIHFRMITGVGRLLEGRRIFRITEDRERNHILAAKWTLVIFLKLKCKDNMRKPGNRAGPPQNARVQGTYPPARALSAIGPEAGDDNLMQAIMNLDRGEERDGLRRKPPFPPVRERSPARRDVPPSPHSRSGSSISSRSYSPERGKALAFPPQQGKRYEEPYGPGRAPDREKPPGPSVNASRDGSPHSSVSASKEEMTTMEAPAEELPVTSEEVASVMDDFQERRAQAIAAKAREIEKVYRQDCETFGMVVKMLVAKEPSLEKHLQNPLKENLIEIRERCLEDLRHFIADLDEVVRQPEPAV
ncbi:putative periphilin-1 [Triplophysa rosa]|uniref:Periphilin-1 n=1 Tax=Triplophysa rosa TaxID=992332 RepID=A0A9W7WBC7_TRIRA|nr:putative periphilin-1 [Triplophysa rosa]